MPLENILKSDIFFFITSISVIILTLMISIISVYIIRILRDVRLIIKDVKFKYRFIKKFINSIIK